MKRRRPRLKFLLDEGVIVSAGTALEAAGHEVIFFDKSGAAKGSSDRLVAFLALINDAILVAQDTDMKSLARGHGIKPALFKSLSLLQLCCRESMAPQRIKEAMSLIEHEWGKGRGNERRIHIVISDGVIRTYR